MGSPSVEQIDSWLPQTQCTQCGYPRCEAYAQAIAAGEADINQCPPGGNNTINGLARLLATAAKPLNPKFGRHEPKVLVAIDENLCIGCTLCIQACPVDAIVGAAKLMHTVIAAECTGCELCISPCPVDCIETYPAPVQQASAYWRWPKHSPAQTERARTQTQARLRRLSQQSRDKALKRKHKALQRRGASDLIQKKIKAAVLRTRSRRETTARSVGSASRRDS